MTTPRSSPTLAACCPEPSTATTRGARYGVGGWTAECWADRTAALTMPWRRNPWRDSTAQDFADRHDARLAVGRSAACESTPWTLSPAALRRAPAAPRLVLPSPNGSAISAAAHRAGATVAAACLRNATAVARRLAEDGYGTPERPLGVIAAGERWPDGTLRPALEDLLGAGAVIAALRELGCGPLSPEAAMAGAAPGAAGDVAREVWGSVSGRELTDGGFAEDVAVAVELEASAVVPVLVDGAFTALS